MTKTVIKGLILPLIILSLVRCKDDEEQIPSYIYLAPFQMSGTPTLQGSLKQNLNDAWLYVNGSYAGAYSLPAQIPVLASGTTEIQIFPGIIKNGSITNRFPYPFVNDYKTTINLTPTKLDTIRAVTSYASDIVFAAIEDFENVHFFIQDVDLDPLTNIVMSTPEEAFEGQHSGLIQLDSVHQGLESWYAFGKAVPVTPNSVYIEVVYKSNIKFAIGLVGLGGNEPTKNIDGIVLPNSEWTHVYFDFTAITNQAKKESYKLAIQAVYDPNQKDKVQQILLDNIKLIYRP